MSVLESLDLSPSYGKKEYRRLLQERQLELRTLALRLYEARRSMVIVYEGQDASGKGGNIRRLTRRLDPRGYHVYRIGAPEGEDRERHYLWRFWRRLLPPEDKQIVIFDRSWYGRVLVERVEQLAAEHEWRRAYGEIVELERQLHDAGTMIVKFWLQISRDEQLRRFRKRRETPHKAFKLTDEDWRNRARWDDYSAAVEDMVAETHTGHAPWHLVAAESKRWARVEIQRIVIERLTRELA